MSLSAASILVGTTLAGTGGTATTFKTLGNTLTQHNLLLDDGSEFINQTELDFTIKSPKVDTSAPNGYTQQRMTCVIKRPLALDNGNRTVNTVRIEISVDHEATASEIDSLRELAAQVVFDADYDDFWQSMSLA